MTEHMVWLHPQPEIPPEKVIVVIRGKEVTIPTEDLGAYSADAMHHEPQDTNELQGDNNGNSN